MYPFGHGLRAGDFGGVLPPFHKEIREESRNQSCGRHSHILQVCLQPSYAVSQQGINLSDIPFTALDRSFIDKYDLHLRTDCQLGAGTILLLTTQLMTVIRRAKSAGILTSNPFAGYEAERPAREIKYLTEQELERIMSTPLHNRKLYHIRDLFLFSCFTGIPYGDMCRLSDEDLVAVEDGTLWIKTSRKKNKNQL